MARTRKCMIEGCERDGIYGDSLKVPKKMKLEVALCRDHHKLLVQDLDGDREPEPEARGTPCQRCGEYCVAHACGKTKDGFSMTWPGGRVQNGYVPPDEISGVRAGGSSDYMEVFLCLACGQVQGEWPKKSVKKWRDYATGNPRQGGGS